MIASLLALYHNTYVHGAVLGFLIAFGVDVRAFIASNGWKVEGWSLAVASKHWVTGAIVGTGLFGTIG